MELKRFTRLEYVLSALAHVAGLAVLLWGGANSFKSRLPDAMVVELVPPNEFARFQGPLVEATSSGVESRSDSDGTNATAQPQPPPTKVTAGPPQQPRPKSAAQPDARQAPAVPEAAKPDTALPQMLNPLLASTAPLQPPTEENGQGIGEEFAMPLALPGAHFGGGFDAPAINAPKAEHDYTALFRARVSSCSRLPPGIASDENIRVSLLVSFNRDGTLAWTPTAIAPMFSPKAPALLQSAIAALQKCQPYTMLPPEKYDEWKSLPLVVTPINFAGN